MSHPHQSSTNHSHQFPFSFNSHHSLYNPHSLLSSSFNAHESTSPSTTTASTITATNLEQDHPHPHYDHKLVPTYNFDLSPSIFNHPLPNSIEVHLQSSFNSNHQLSFDYNNLNHSPLQHHHPFMNSLDLLNYPSNSSFPLVPPSNSPALIHSDLSDRQPPNTNQSNQQIGSCQLSPAHLSPTSSQNQLDSCEGRASRSGSISSESNSSLAPPPPTFGVSGTLSSDWLVLEDEEGGWEMRSVEEESRRRRSQSEGDLVDRLAMSAEESCFQPTFDAPGAREYVYGAQLAEEQNIEGLVGAPFSGRRKAMSMVERWSGGQLGRTDALYPAPRIDSARTPEIKVNDESVFRPGTGLMDDGPILATFELPPPVDVDLDLDQQSAFSDQLAQRPTTSCESLSFESSFSASGSAEFQSPSSGGGPGVGGSGNGKSGNGKSGNRRSKRTGNNGGRSRRLAPANRVCRYCGAKFTRNDRLNYHIDSIHEYKEPKFICSRSDCARAFRQRSDLVRHIKHVHHDS